MEVLIMEKRNYIVKDENGKPIKTFFCKNADSVGTWTRDEYFRKGLGKKVYIYDTNGTLHVTAEILKKKDGTIGQRWSRAAGNTSGGAMNENNAKKTESEKRNWLNNRGDFVLCDNNVADSEEIVDILTKSGIFPVDLSGILRRRYEKMCDRKIYLEEWQEDDGKWKQDGYDIEKGARTDLQAALLSVPTDDKWGELNEVCNLGHDLPTWMYYGTPRQNRDKRLRIMIVSQDPLRRLHDKGKLLLSSPWALHSRNYLRKGATLPKHIIHELLECGAIVYVTDFFKLYATNHSKESENILKDNGDFAEKCKACLDAEIKAFKPDFMMIYGRDAEKGLFGNEIRTPLAGRPKRKYKTTNCFVVLHTNAHAAGTDEQKIPYYTDIFFPSGKEVGIHD